MSSVKITHKETERPIKFISVDSTRGTRITLGESSNNAAALVISTADVIYALSKDDAIEFFEAGIKLAKQ